MKPLARFLLLIAASFAIALVARADEVILTNGRSIHGKVVSEGKREVRIEVVPGKVVGIERRLVKEIRRSEGSAKPKGAAPSTQPAASLRLAWSIRPTDKPLRYRSRVSFGTTASKTRKSLGLLETTTDLTLKCLEARAKDLTLEVRITRSRERKVDKEGNTALRDTESKDPAKLIERTMIDQPIVFRLSRQGELLELVSVAGMTIKTLEEAEGAKLERSIGGYVLRLGLFGLSGPFPKTSVDKASRPWKASLLLPSTLVGDMQMRVVNSLSTLDSSAATLKQAGKVEVLGLKKRLVTGSRIVGEVRFSRRGFLVSVRQTSTIRLRYDAAGKPFEAETWVKVETDQQ